MKSWFSKNKMVIVAAVFLIFIVTMIAYSSMTNRNTNAGMDKVILRTNMGDITIELYDDMPITTGNFKNLVKRGVYDNTTFHRVVAGFVIQGGDPTGTGAGDPSIPTIPDEFGSNNRNDKYTVAMAKKPGENGHAQPNSASSQFYINLADNNNLDSEYSVFGRVIDGTNVVDNIGKLPTDSNQRPNFKVIIEKAELVEQG
jgi:peptidylprolyl isomerase